jgi:protein-disulfide isomerase
MRDRLKLPAAQFDRCLYDDTTIAKAQKIYEETKKAGVRATPTYLVNGRKLRHHELVELLNDL